MRVYLSEELQKLNIPFTAPKPGDAGYDLYSLEAVTIPPGEHRLIATGVHVEIPAGYVGLIKDRSSMALAGIHTMGGVIDSAYRGEIKIILLNTNTDGYAVERGQKIAQMVVIPCYTKAVQPVAHLEDLTSTTRGKQGFGSTGKGV